MTNVIQFPDRSPPTDSDVLRLMLTDILGADSLEEARRIAAIGIEEVDAMEAANRRQSAPAPGGNDTPQQ